MKKSILKINGKTFTHELYLESLFKAIEELSVNWENRENMFTVEDESGHGIAFLIEDSPYNVFCDIIAAIEHCAEYMLNNENFVNQPNIEPILNRILMFVKQSLLALGTNIHSDDRILWSMRNYPVNDYVDMNEDGTITFWHEPELQYHDKPNKPQIAYNLTHNNV